MRCSDFHIGSVLFTCVFGRAFVCRRERDKDGRGKKEGEKKRKGKEKREREKGNLETEANLVNVQLHSSRIKKRNSPISLLHLISPH